jgi:hypothetical protein
MRFTLALSLAAMLAASRPAAAQVTVTPVRDLAFGPVIVGVPTYIGPSHPVRSGQFRVSAPLLSRLQLRFTLPSRLNGPAGATLPINFANNDALQVGTGSNGVPVTFNPQATRNFQMTDSAILVFIGGTVSPAGNQPQGNYTGTITLTVNIQ